MTLMLITPIILEMNYILHLWLGDAVPPYTNIFASLVLVDAMINTLNAPVTQVVFATGSIKKYQIWSAVINILLIPTCWFFLKIGYEAWIVFLLTIIISILCQIACLIIMHDVFQYSYKEYAFKIIMPCFVMTIIVPLLPFTITRLMEESLLRLLMVCLTSLIVSVTLFYFAFEFGDFFT